MRPKKLLIVSASIGGGHVAAGRALESAAKDEGLNVQHVDMLSYTAPGFRRMYRQTYFDLVRTAPDVVDWFGKRLDRRPLEFKTRQERVIARFSRLVSYNLPRLVRKTRPDVIVHTHFLPPAILSHQEKLSVPEAVVITDYAAHALWLQRGVRRYFVATNEVAAHLEAVGISEQRVRVTGIPIEERFIGLESKTQARQALGLSAERDVLLLMASGLDQKVLVSLLQYLKALRWPLTVFVICGRTENLVKAAMKEVDAHDSESLVTLKVRGFVGEMPRYMAAADLLLGKPGGLTTSEALAVGLPFAVVSPYPLQEEANANMLLEQGAGFRIEPLTVLNYKLKAFFADAARRERMSEAARRLAKPRAAQEVIRSLLEEPLHARDAL